MQPKTRRKVGRRKIEAEGFKRDHCGSLQALALVHTVFSSLCLQQSRQASRTQRPVESGHEVLAASPSEAAAIATAAAADGSTTNGAPATEGLVFAAAASTSRSPQFAGQDGAAALSSAVSGAESDSDLATSESDDDDDGCLLHLLLDQVGDCTLHLALRTGHTEIDCEKTATDVRSAHFFPTAGRSAGS